MTDPIPINFPTLYYHNRLHLNLDYNRAFFEAFRQAFAEYTHELTNHVYVETKYQPTCETDTDRERGVMIRPTILFWLLNKYPHVTKEINQLIPPDNNNVLMINWLSLFNLSDDDLDSVFSLYKGHVFIDDTVEVHPIRTYVMEKFLKSLGYNLDNVTFWTTCPTPDNKFEDTILRHNWIHLQEYGRTLNKKTQYKIPYFNEEQLLNYDNKKFKVLSLNGHSTNTREYVISRCIKAGLANKENTSNELRYSMIDAWEGLPSNCWFSFEGRDEWFPRMLPGDFEELWIRDRSSNPQWWYESFFNLNIETNVNWITPNVRLITEKWMKGILYLTPSFNVGEYPGLEEYQKNLGFNTYINHIDREYDTIDDFKTRCKKLVSTIKDTPIPDKKEWKMMNMLAKQNYNHFHNSYIPELEKTFINKLLEKTT